MLLSYAYVARGSQAYFSTVQVGVGELVILQIGTIVDHRVTASKMNHFIPITTPITKEKNGSHSFQFLFHVFGANSNP